MAQRKLTAMSPHLSVIVCVYNEVDNIRPLVEKIRKDLVGLDYELIYVDDGSTDGTVAALKEVLYDRLRIVERAFERDGVDVGIGDRRHLPTLHVGHATVRVHDEDVDLIEAAESLNGRGAGIARSRADDGRALAARFQRVVHQAAEQLHRHVLEGERGAVEEFEQEEIVGELRQRRDRRVAERAVGVRDHRRQVFARNGVADEGGDDRLGGFRIGAAGEPRDGGRVKLRISFRQVEPAIGRKPGQRRLGEIQRGRFAAGGNVAHVGFPN